VVKEADSRQQAADSGQTDNDDDVHRGDAEIAETFFPVATPVASGFSRTRA